ncbi:MAG: NUDIX hydrolase [Methanobacteriota archaeon]
MMASNKQSPKAHNVILSVPVVEVEKEEFFLFGLKNRGRYAKPYWTFPGSGHVEEGEILSEALARELWEEIRVAKDSFTSEYLGEFMDAEYEPPHRTNVFLVRICGNTSISREIIKTRLVKITDLDKFFGENLVSKSVKEAIKLMNSH